MALKWDPGVFKEVAQETRIKEGTPNWRGAYLVLVEGQRLKEASLAVGKLDTEISRSVRTLREAFSKKRSELDDPVKLQDAAHVQQANETQSLKVITAWVRQSYGNDAIIREAQKGFEYEGLPVYRSSQHFVQQGIMEMGRPTLVIHDLALLDKVPEMDQGVVNIRYPQDGSIGRVAEAGAKMGRGPKR